MTILLFLSICTITLLCLIAYRQNICEPYYKRINIKGESPWKCGSVEYGSVFDYKKQKVIKHMECQMVVKNILIYSLASRSFCILIALDNKLPDELFTTDSACFVLISRSSSFSFFQYVYMY